MNSPLGPFVICRPRWVWLTLLFVGTFGCRLSDEAASPDSPRVLAQDVFLAHNPEAKSLSIESTLTIRLPDVTVGSFPLEFPPSLSFSFTSVRDEEDRAVEHRWIDERLLSIQLRKESSRSVSVTLSYSVDYSRSDLPGLYADDEGWLVLSEPTPLLPRIRRSGDREPFSLTVTCRAAPGQIGIASGTIQSLPGQPASLTRFQGTHDRRGLAVAFGPLRSVRAGTSTTPVMFWVRSNTAASRCQEIGQQLANAAEALVESLGPPHTDEGITIVEYPGSTFHSSYRTLFVPTDLLQGDDVLLPMTRELTRSWIGPYGRRVLPREHAQWEEALVTYLAIRALERSGSPQQARTALREASRTLKEIDFEEPREVAAKASGLASLIRAADLSLLPLIPSEPSLVEQAVRKELARPRVDGFSWPLFRSRLIALAADSNPEADAKDIVDYWLDRRAIPEVRYSWTTTTRPHATRLTLTLLTPSPMRLPATVRLWGDETRQDTTLDRRHETDPRHDVRVSFQPRWVELDPHEEWPIRFRPQKRGRETDPARFIKGGDRLVRVPGWALGLEDRIEWDPRDGLRAFEVGRRRQPLAPHRPDLLENLDESELTAYAVRHPGEPIRFVDLYGEDGIVARLGVEADQRLSSLMLLSTEGHMLAWMRWQELSEFGLPKRLTVDSPLLGDGLTVEGSPNLIKR